MWLVAPIHLEPSSSYVGYVYTHEHDFVLSNKRVKKYTQLLGCQICNILYCERCGKEVTIPSSNFEAKGKEFECL